MLLVMLVSYFQNVVLYLSNKPLIKTTVPYSSSELCLIKTILIENRKNKIKKKSLKIRVTEKH